MESELRFPVLPINPDISSLDKLLGELKRELAKAVAVYVVGELDKREKCGIKNTKL